MLDSNEEILSDIEQTIAQLTKNAVAIKEAKACHHFAHEIDQLERLQESLLARLMHRQELLAMNQREKITKSIRKETLEKKVIEYAKSIKSRPQKPASFRRARSKS